MSNWLRASSDFPLLPIFFYAALMCLSCACISRYYKLLDTYNGNTTQQYVEPIKIDAQIDFHQPYLTRRQRVIRSIFDSLCNVTLAAPAIEQCDDLDSMACCKAKSAHDWLDRRWVTLTCLITYSPATISKPTHVSCFPDPSYTIASPPNSEARITPKTKPAGTIPKKRC